MLIALLWIRRVFCVLAAVAPAACAQHGSAILPAQSTPSLIQASQTGVLPDAVPPRCPGQKSTSEYASLTVTLSPKGGSFCIPAIAGFGGSVKYPGANPPVKLKLISSVENYNHQPQLGKGTPIFFLQLALSGGTTFGSNSSAGGGLTAKTIVPGKPYTAYGQAVISGFTFPLGPCYAIATKGKYGGVIGGIGTLLKNVSLPVAASGVIEIYAGKQGGGKC